eukprot:GEZU01035892.1.p2 GENE.GEZU01035892.1~~GEZU01035892.1.p2  ORF type:complete len:118 (-),score=6.11 GEZU01035892.1:365-718(-)
MLSADQLIIEMKLGNVFKGFHEGKISFAPTYRYNRGDRTFSTEKRRTPSYCDRILWKSFPGCPAMQITYDSTPKVTTSDHSPVFAVFNVATQLPYLSVFEKPPPRRTIRFTNVFVSG